jgi:hypothetical protein
MSLLVAYLKGSMKLTFFNLKKIGCNILFHVSSTSGFAITHKTILWLMKGYTRGCLRLTMMSAYFLSFGILKFTHLRVTTYIKSNQEFHLCLHNVTFFIINQFSQKWKDFLFIVYVHLFFFLIKNVAWFIELPPCTLLKLFLIP